MNPTQATIHNPANFRDLGGISGFGGKKVISGRLLRCGQLLELSTSELSLLQNTYSISTVIDFRSSVEVKQEPDFPLPGAAHIHLDIFEGLTELAPNQDYMSKLTSPQAVDDFMIHTYQLMVTDPTALAKYQRFLHLLLETSEGGVLFHCQAGKDRTGIGAALILSILGVSQDDIMADYLLTNKMRAAHNQALLNDLLQKGLPEDRLPALKTALTVNAAYLEAAFNTITKHYGTMNDFIKTGLRLTNLDVEGLQNKYLC